MRNKACLYFKFINGMAFLVSTAMHDLRYDQLASGILTKQESEGDERRHCVALVAEKIFPISAITH